MDINGCTGLTETSVPPNPLVYYNGHRENIIYNNNIFIYNFIPISCSQQKIQVLKLMQQIHVPMIKHGAKMAPFPKQSTAPGHISIGPCADAETGCILTGSY